MQMKTENGNISEAAVMNGSSNGSTTLNNTSTPSPPKKRPGDPLKSTFFSNSRFDLLIAFWVNNFDRCYCSTPSSTPFFFCFSIVSKAAQGKRIRIIESRTSTQKRRCHSQRVEKEFSVRVGIARGTVSCAHFHYVRNGKNSAANPSKHVLNLVSRQSLA